MIICVGSTNPVKVLAVEEYFSEICKIEGLTITALKSDSGVAAQPITLAETIQGSINRAKFAFTANTYLGVGIEGGITPIPNSITGYMNICAGCLYDGKHTYIGLSSGFEHPQSVLSSVLSGQVEVSEAYQLCGLHDSKLIGQGQGAVGFMTNNQLSRKDYCIQALIPAYGSFCKKHLLIS